MQTGQNIADTNDVIMTWDGACPDGNYRPVGG